MITDELVNKVLARFSDELAEADDLQLRHLAERAEGRYTTALGDRMRDLVDEERARRDFGLKRADIVWTVTS